MAVHLKKLVWDGGWSPKKSMYFKLKHFIFELCKPAVFTVFDFSLWKQLQIKAHDLFMWCIMFHEKNPLLLIAIFYKTPTKHHCASDFSVFTWYLHTAASTIYRNALSFTYLQANLVVNALPLFSTPRPIFASVNVCWMLTQLVIANTKALHIVLSLHQLTHPPSLSPPPTLGCLQLAKLWAVWRVHRLSLPFYCFSLSKSMMTMRS